MLTLGKFPLVSMCCDNMCIPVSSMVCNNFLISTTGRLHAAACLRNKSQGSVCL